MDKSRSDQYGKKGYEWWPYPQGKVERSEVLEAMRKLKVGQAPDIDHVTAYMLIHREAVVEWMVWTYNLE